MISLRTERAGPPLDELDIGLTYPFSPLLARALHYSFAQVACAILFSDSMLRFLGVEDLMQLLFNFNEIFLSGCRFSEIELNFVLLHG